MEHRKLMTKLIVSSILILILASCSYSEKAPLHWGVTNQSYKNGTNISGSFENIGENAKGGKTRLSLLFFPTWEMVYDESITRIGIEQPDNETIKVSVYSAGKKIKETMFSKLNGDFERKHEWYKINQSAHPPLSKFLAGRSWGDIYLKINRNEELVIQKKESTVAMFGVIPMAEHDTTWYRFRKVKSVK